MAVPRTRIEARNSAPIRADGAFVLYWMIAYRRLEYNFALQRAVELGQELHRPVVILEALRCDYPWASDRLHQFILDGMAEHARRARDLPVTYYPFIETQPNAGKGLLKSLSEDACAVVTDEFPAFFMPAMVRAASQQLSVRLEQVDSNGLLPLRAADRTFTAAHSFRTFLQHNLAPWLRSAPTAHPLATSGLPRLDALPLEVLGRWPVSDPLRWASGKEPLASLPIDHDVAPVEARGGTSEALDHLESFLRRRVHDWPEARNHPDDSAVSGLSPYLHFGHISTHEVLASIAREQDWTVDKFEGGAGKGRHGFWGLPESLGAFLDQLVTWRELGFNFCSRTGDYAAFEKLPSWARETLEVHASDRRQHTYSLEQFAAADTHDPVWNAAQRQLLREGTIHNYLRMLWGKKILEWTSSPRQALAVMIELNNKYAVDGRDPNSYSGISWILGRYDRAWGPERPIFGKIRFMSTTSATRKLRMEEYMNRYGGRWQ